jgi:glutathione S-transferase
MSSSGPKAPEGWTAPEPRLAYVRPASVGAVLRSGLASALRAGSGAFVEGYNARLEGGKVVESSTTLPSVKPKELPVLYAYDACPYCAKVFEAVNILDIDVLVKPTPRGSTIHRAYVAENGGRVEGITFPYLEDSNTGFKAFESADIIKYLYQTYGPANTKVPAILGSSIGTVSASLAAAASGLSGRKRAPAVVVAPEPLELYSYHASPFCKIVRERLCELEIPYILHTACRGSPTRAALKVLTGRCQLPYLIDSNTGCNMFESVAMVEYLDAVYGPDAPGAQENPFPMAASAIETVAVDSSVSAPAPDPTPAPVPVPVAAVRDLSPEIEVIDEMIDANCAKNPDADECRTYDS